MVKNRINTIFVFSVLSDLKLILCLITLSRITYLICTKTPLGDGGGGGI